ncbi:MAG: sn-glycerol-3-phosphate ABC transporter ATP-binding protein UgpC [Desulfosarcinaceae bacterium]|nr:sn-glycerol-3-phosphate ABC transporter ATP-binding protein UgpC [Desulfosarcinaceae bacterium]
MASLTIRDARKAFGKVDVLKGIDIDVASGEFLVLVGPSGCGKSTLLNLIAGLETITSGEIRIGDRIVNTVSPKDRDIAMVFQSYALYPNMNVRKNISFGLETRKTPPAEIDAIVANVAKTLQIEELLDRKPKQLSGGQRQRVAMGRALARNPAVFLFDEPLSNLDAKLRVEMRTEIKLLHQRIGTTIVYVTHDQIEAMTLADRIAVMKDGIVQQLDSPRNIYENPTNRFVAGFIGSPAMNFIPCRVAAQDGRPTLLLTNDTGQTYHLSPERWSDALAGRMDQEVILGLRPEHIADDIPLRNGDPSARMHLESTVQVVEPTGPDTLVMVPLNDTEVTCRVHPAAARAPGERMPLSIDLSKAILFDPDAETRLQ